MKSIVAALSLFLLVTGCRNSPAPIIDPVFADSLIKNYSSTPSMQSADSNLLFWLRRMEAQPENFVNGPKYAAALAARFRLYGDIRDLLKADSLLQRSNDANQGKEPDIWRSLVSFALLQHQFSRADSLLQEATRIDGRNIANTYFDFDIRFERGDYAKASALLNSLEKDRSYGYFFRRSKYEHYNGSLDSSISYMLQAAGKSDNNKHLLQAALSNAADLHVHKGDMDAANDLYIQSIRTDPADLHSVMGLGWIALVHDKKDSLAEKLFRLVQRFSKAPDVLLKFVQVAENRNDTASQQKYAAEFVRITDSSSYGGMYSKYLIDLYTGIMHDPAKAVKIAEKDTYNRPTPQVYAWYAWSLFCNGEPDKAYGIFKGYVSQKPLEALELYYMGKMMQGLNKGYNAQQFYKAAYKNRYDLSPAKIKDLEKNLE
ncbi:MAG: hypothetical protein ABIR30_08895 [Chitinophagaceae bacterium]